MDDTKSEIFIVKMSQTLRVYRSGYYRWYGRGPSQRTQPNKQLTTKIIKIWKDSAKTYGSPPIHAALLDDGETPAQTKYYLTQQSVAA